MKRELSQFRTRSVEDKAVGIATTSSSNSGPALGGASVEYSPSISDCRQRSPRAGTRGGWTHYHGRMIQYLSNDHEVQRTPCWRRRPVTNALVKLMLRVLS